MGNFKSKILVFIGFSTTLGLISCGGGQGTGEQMRDSAQLGLVSAEPPNPMDQPAAQAAKAFLTYYKENYPKFSAIQAKLKVGRGRNNWSDFREWIVLAKESQLTSPGCDSNLGKIFVGFDQRKDDWKILKTDLVVQSDSIPDSIGDLSKLKLVKSNLAGDNAELEFNLEGSKVHLLMKKVNGKWLLNNLVF